MHTIKITPNLLFEYQCTSGKFVRLPNRIKSKNRFGSENRIESKLFCPSWNALLYMCPSHLHRQTRTVLTANNDDRVCPPVRLSVCTAANVSPEPQVRLSPSFFFLPDIYPWLGPPVVNKLPQYWRRRSHRCCHLPNKVENIDRTPDIPGRCAKMPLPRAPLEYMVPWLTRVHTPNGISVGSAVLAHYQ